LYLPPVELSGRFNLFWFVVFLMRFLGSLVVASFQVAFLAFTPRTGRNNSVIAVDLRTRSDFIMTLTAVALSLMPGSFVLDVEREQSILYLHVLGFPVAAAGVALAAIRKPREREPTRLFAGESWGLSDKLCERSVPKLT
jgi:multisubunit Na+/H+ antiporter MnhE subunit